MGQHENDEEKNYFDAVVEAGLMQQYFLEAMQAPHDSPESHEAFSKAFTLKYEIEAKGFPVDYAFHFFHGHNNPDGDSVKMASVTVHRPSKNNTPEQHADYDRWFKKKHGIAEDPPEPDEPSA